MSHPDSWTARRIFRELWTEEEGTGAIADFLKDPDGREERQRLIRDLAGAMRFRPSTVAQYPGARIAKHLIERAASAELEFHLRQVLRYHHFHRHRDLMGRFLDLCGIANDGGVFDPAKVSVPEDQAVRAAAEKLVKEFEPRDVAVYLVSAGLLNGEEISAWRERLWPVAEGLLDPAGTQGGGAAPEAMPGLPLPPRRE